MAGGRRDGRSDGKCYGVLGNISKTYQQWEYTGLLVRFCEKERIFVKSPRDIEQLSQQGD